MDVRSLVAATWPLEVATMEPIPGGISSRTWGCRSTEGDNWVVKLADEGPFLAGLRVAERLAGLGLRTGPPLRTRDGSLAVAVPGGHLAVLRHEAGRPGRLPGDATAMGACLGIRPDIEAELGAYPTLVRYAWLRQVAFWGGRCLAPGSRPAPDDPNWYGFRRSLDILRTGVWRA